MIETLKKNKKGISLMLVSSICVCLGQLFWKLSSNGNLFYLILGFGLYGIGALVMLYAYKFGSLSVLQPMLSMNYVLTIVIANFVLKEPIGLLKFIGILVIICGVVLIGGDDGK